MILTHVPKQGLKKCPDYLITHYRTKVLWFSCYVLKLFFFSQDKTIFSPHEPQLQATEFQSNTENIQMAYSHLFLEDGMTSLLRMKSPLRYIPKHFIAFRHALDPKNMTLRPKRKSDENPQRKSDENPQRNVVFFQFNLWLCFISCRFQPMITCV